MMPRATPFVLMLVLFLNACNANKNLGDFDARDIRPEIMTLAQAVLDDGFIGTEKIGRNPEVSEAHTRRTAFMEAAHIDELVDFLVHPSGILRATAFEGLAVKGYPELKQALLDLSEGDQVLRYIYGDLDFTLPVVEYAYTAVLGRTVPGEQPSYLNDKPMANIELSAAEEAFVVNRILAVRALVAE